LRWASRSPKVPEDAAASSIPSLAKYSVSISVKRVSSSMISSRFAVIQRPPVSKVPQDAQ
jgi:hypothetical protein